MTPRGFRDVLPEEAAEREAIARAVADAMAAWGYGRVETPVVERLDVLEAGAGVDRDAFRLTDLDGTLLALRPEMTLPVARVVASRLADEPGPHRLRYVAPVFRESASLRGESRQFTQLGLELVGASGPEADAEVVAVLVESLRAAGLRGFTVAVGTVALIEALLEASGADGRWRDAVRAAAHRRDVVALDRLAEEASVPAEISAALSGTSRLRGGADAVAEATRLARAAGCADSLDGMAALWDLLAAAGVDGPVIADFGIVRSFDYYTGLVIEAYAPGLGVPVGGGGRYDGLLAALGSPAPAAGFAVGLERLRIALAEQGVGVPTSGPDVVLTGEGERLFAVARQLRSGGRRVVLVPGGSEADARALAERSGADLVRVPDVGAGPDEVRG